MSYSDNNEFILRPSYWLVFPSAVLAIALSFFQFPFLLIYPIYRTIEIYFWRYEFNEMTVTERTGVFSVERREMYYSRIKSISIHEPFIFRLVGLCNIHVISSEPNMQNLYLNAIPHREKVKKYLSGKYYNWRKEEGVKEFDLYNL